MKKQLLCMLIMASVVSASLAASTLKINTKEARAEASPILYGLMTEEINYCYDGGLYAETVRNRAFKDHASRPVHWSLLDDNSTMELDKSTPLSDAIDVSLKWTILSKKPSKLANAGWWGIPVRPKTKYNASFYAKSTGGSGPVGVAIMDKAGKTVYAKATVEGVGAEWKKYEVALETGNVEPTADAQLVLAAGEKRTIWLSLVSLFPPTWNDRPNGLRKDLMQMLVDLEPKFLRFPGGNYLEGNRIEERFKWWETLGDLKNRPGHPCPWGYRSSDGMGLHEFLLWAEDLGAEPIVGLYAGYSLDKSFIAAGPELEPYVKEAMDELEYIVGPVDSEWGAKRASAGHPEPFPLRYVEIGNEDWFDRAGEDGKGSYNERFAQFYDAIHEKYPQLKIISSIGNEHAREGLLVTRREPDVLDEHYYRSTEEFLSDSMSYYEKYDRDGPEIFVGEWAAHEDASLRPWDARSRSTYPATPGMLSAIGDAAFMAAMERNCDIVTLQAYAPLFVNLNEYQWRPDLIAYNAIKAYGSPSYYALKMFSTNVGNELLAAELSEKSTLHYSITRDSEQGLIYIKLVNPEHRAENIRIELDGTKQLAPNALVEVLTGNLDSYNSIDDPKKVVPKSSRIKGVKPTFDYQVPADSVVVLTVKAL